ncbi:MAG: PDZ domain-containing protein [Clostridia bacterium]|nr:PDZ domain-containing protein [Clostridia bacterium]
MNGLRKRLTSLLLAAAMLLTLSLPALADETVPSEAPAEEGYQTVDPVTGEIRDFSKLEQVYEIYRDHYYVVKDGEQILLDTLKTLLETDPSLFDEVMNALMKSGDSFSRYYAPEVAEAEATSKEYGGVGMTVQQQDDGRILVVELTKDGTAEKAGVQIGDQIMAIDGHSVLNLTIEAAVEIGRGEVGTEVTYSFYRASTGSLFSLTMVRGEMTTETVTWEYITDEATGVTYAECRINDFVGMSTYVEFLAFYKELQAGSADRVLFDLRNNPGGDLTIVLDLINMMLPGKGKIITNVIPREPEEPFSYETTGRGIPLEKIVILVDDTTASAAELFAITLQEYGLATVVGTQTFGKAIGQQYFELKDGSQAIITAMQVTTPSGFKYNEIGVTPDVVVENTEVPRELPEFKELSEKNYERVSFAASNAAVEALEQRLVLLGVMREADRDFDRDTLQALKIYQGNMGLPVTGKLDLDTLNSILEMTEVVKEVRYYHDDQHDKAVELITAAEEILPQEQPAA